MKIFVLSFITTIACFVALAAARPSATSQFRHPRGVQVQNRFGKLRPLSRNKSPQVSVRRHQQLPAIRTDSPRLPFSRKLNKFEYLAASLPKLWQTRIGKGAFKITPSRYTLSENRRRATHQNGPEFVYKKAEDISGYQRFTLDEAVIPDKPRARSDDFIESDDETTTTASKIESETASFEDQSSGEKIQLTTESPTLSP